MILPSPKLILLTALLLTLSSNAHSRNYAPSSPSPSRPSLWSTLTSHSTRFRSLRRVGAASSGKSQGAVQGTLQQPAGTPATAPSSNATAAGGPAMNSTIPSNSPTNSSSAKVKRAYDPSFGDNCQCGDFCGASQWCDKQTDGSLILRTDDTHLGGFSCNKRYVFGVFSVRMKLPANYSGGVIPCMYMTSPGTTDFHTKHDEIDFEFLGDTSAQNITIHTNLISEGWQKLEQYTFPFDPSADFHSYSIIWSHAYIMWMIDDTPIRVTYKQSDKPFPSLPLGMQGSMWSAPWLQLRPNFSSGPYSLAFREFKFFGCDSALPGSDLFLCTRSQNASLPWMRPIMGRQLKAMRDFQTNHTRATFDWATIQ